MPSSLRVFSLSAIPTLSAIAFGVSGADVGPERRTFKGKELFVPVNRGALLCPSGSNTKFSWGRGNPGSPCTHLLLAFSALARLFYGNKNFPPPANFLGPQRIKGEKDMGSV